ncbi:MAG: PEP-CTERM sorting domain-containing protein [Planctomycetota bacterium]|nr:PEP-CTERM sorting domain-containing protein [Planctomycetota bacterium]
MKHVIFALAVAALVCTGAASSQAGPIGTYYLTDFENAATAESKLTAIRGNNYQENASYFQEAEGPIAVVGGVVRTTGFIEGVSGGEYATVPSLTVTQTGTSYTNAFAAPVDEQYYDGTSDGQFNYTVEFFTGNVIRTDTSWGGTATLLFSTGGYADLGITYDRSNSSLWIQNHSDGQITNYTLTGSVLSTFAIGITPTDQGFTALAMDVDHTLWFNDFRTGTIYHFTTSGILLGSDTYAGLGRATGGEIAAIPEPSTLALISLGGIGLVVGAYRRRAK